MTPESDAWKVLVAFAGVVISTLCGAIVFLVGWIRNLYAAAKVEAAEEVRRRDARHEKLLDVVERMERQIARRPSPTRDEP